MGMFSDLAKKKKETSDSFTKDNPVEETTTTRPISNLFTKQKLSDAKLISKTPDELPKSNDIHGDIQFPAAPPLDADAETRFKYQMEKLNLAVAHPTMGRETLAELHSFLLDHHDQKLMPDDLSVITRTMMNLGAHHHKKAQVRKSKSQARISKREDKAEAIDKVSEGLGNLF